MRWTILLTTFCLVARAGDITLPVTFEKVTEYLRAHPEVRSIDAFLPALPEDYRANFTLMHHSNSLQSATPAAPRAILYGPDARFIVAFNSDPKADRFDSLETIQFRDGEKAFEFHEIRFPESDVSKQVEISEKNPPLCLQCHFQDPRPNWEHYSDWPGAFGEDDDQNRTLGNEGQAFLKTAENMPRFRHIPQLADSYLHDPHDSFRTKVVHNINFTQRVAQLNFQRITRLMQASPRYAQFKYAALGAIGCDGRFENFFTDEARQRFPDLVRNHYYHGPEALPAFFGALGEDTRSWYLDFVAKKPEFTTPGNSFVEFTAAVGLSDEDLSPFVEVDRTEYAGVPWVRGHVRGNRCEELQRKSREAMAELQTE